MTMTNKAKRTVEQGYNSIAGQYFEWTQAQRSDPRVHYTEKVLENTLEYRQVLEIGCGSGIPVTRMLLDRGAQVTANDISIKQIGLAKETCPQATFIPGDMTALGFSPSSFDGVTCFFAIFHLPRAEQKNMITKICSWLKPGGKFCFNFATIDQEEIHGEMFGQKMFWSSYGMEENKAMVLDAGFEISEAEVLQAGNGELKEGDLDHDKKFLWIVANKKVDG